MRKIQKDKQFILRNYKIDLMIKKRKKENVIIFNFLLTKNLPSATGIYQYKNIKTKIKERKVIKISPPKSERDRSKRRHKEEGYTR